MEARKRKTRLLLAEDNRINQKVVLAILRNYGFSCETVSNGEDAVNYAKKQPYHIILMDCDMPILNGYEATGLIRKNESGDWHTNIIALTASTMKGDREKCLAAGMDDYLAKPIESQALVKLLEKYLDN